MARATLVLPDILRESLGTTTVAIEGRTIGDALEKAWKRDAALKMHLRDEAGGLRFHLLCFHNGAHVKSLDVPLKDGDEISILQAVSGG